MDVWEASDGFGDSGRADGAYAVCLGRCARPLFVACVLHWVICSRFCWVLHDGGVLRISARLEFEHGGLAGTSAT